MRSVYKAETINTVPLDQAFEIPSPSNCPDKIVEEKILTEQVYDIIQSLPDKQREALKLYYFSEYSQAEIGAFLYIPVATVKSRLHDARKTRLEGITLMVKNKLQKKRPSRDTSFATQIEMINACKVGDAERVAELLEINPALAISDSTWTPIH